MTDLDRLDAGECGFNEWHEPHGYVVAEGGAAAEYECPGLTAPDPATIRGLVAAARERDELREAAEAVVKRADTDDDFDGQFVDYLVPADVLDALRAALHREAGA